MSNATIYLQLFVEAHCLIYVIYLCLRTVVANTCWVDVLLCVYSCYVPYDHLAEITHHIK